MVRSVRKLSLLVSGVLLLLATTASAAFGQEAPPEPEDTSDAGQAFWFNSPAVRWGFFAILIVTLLAVIAGYLVKVVVPKYRGRPA